jgi:hypothetical protein
MGPSRPEAITPPQADLPTANQYDSQYVAPLQTLPPTAQQSTSYVEAGDGAKVPRHSVVVPWIAVAMGLVVPLFALLTALWAVSCAREGDMRHVPLALAGFAVFALAYVPV